MLNVPLFLCTLEVARSIGRGCWPRPGAELPDDDRSRTVPALRPKATATLGRRRILHARRQQAPALGATGAS